MFVFTFGYDGQVITGDFLFMQPKTLRIHLVGGITFRRKEWNKGWNLMIIHPMPVCVRYRRETGFVPVFDV